MTVTKRTFIDLAGTIQGRVRNDIAKRDFHSLFGVSPEVCFGMWKRCRIPPTTKILPKHFLWALMFMKVYGSEAVLCALAKTSKKTLRCWVWRVIPRVAGMYSVLVRVNLPSFYRHCSLFPLTRFCCNRCGGETGSDLTKEGRAR